MRKDTLLLCIIATSRLKKLGYDTKRIQEDLKKDDKSSLVDALYEAILANRDNYAGKELNGLYERICSRE